MIVKTIINEEEGRKWEIIKHEEDRYSYNYYEYFKATGWRLYDMPRKYYSKDVIEFEFNLKLA